MYCRAHEMSGAVFNDIVEVIHEPIQSTEFLMALVVDPTD